MVATLHLLEVLCFSWNSYPSFRGGVIPFHNVGHCSSCICGIGIGVIVDNDTSRIDTESRIKLRVNLNYCNGHFACNSGRIWLDFIVLASSIDRDVNGGPICRNLLYQ